MLALASGERHGVNGEARDGEDEEEADVQADDAQPDRLAKHGDVRTEGMAQAMRKAVNTPKIGAMW